MFNPKTPVQAGLIFAAGLAVIAWTTNDVYRTSKQNAQGLNPEQMKALQDFGNEARKKAAGAGHGLMYYQPNLSLACLFSNSTKVSLVKF